MHDRFGTVCFAFGHIAPTIFTVEFIARSAAEAKNKEMRKRWEMVRNRRIWYGEPGESCSEVLLTARSYFSFSTFMPTQCDRVG